MEFVNEMYKGMEIIAKACESNDSWTKCKECPFDDFCDLIMQNDPYAKTPAEIFKEYT